MSDLGKFSATLHSHRHSTKKTIWKKKDTSKNSPKCFHKKLQKTHDEKGKGTQERSKGLAVLLLSLNSKLSTFFLAPFYPRYVVWWWRHQQPSTQPLIISYQPHIWFWQYVTKRGLQIDGIGSLLQINI